MRDFLQYKARHNCLLERKIKVIRNLHEMSPARLRDYENSRFLAMLDHAYHYSPFYKKYYNEYGVDIKAIQSIDDIGKLPIIDKDMVWHYKAHILTRPAFCMFKGFTSGTSGSSLTVYRTLGAIILENAYIWHFRNMHGIHRGDKLVVIRGDLSRDQLSKFDKYTNTLFLSSYNINKGNIFKYIKLLLDFNPSCIMGYPSSLEMLSNELSKANVQVNIPIAFTSSETLYSFQRTKIKNHIGAETFDWYGNAERTVAIEQCPGGQYYFVPGYSVNEVFDDRLLTTALINRAFPLIRYKVNDIIELSAEKRDANTLSAPASIRIDRIHGRDDDYIFLPDGTRIGRMSKAFKGIDEILFAQILQDEVDCIVLNIVPSSARFDDTEVLKRMRSLLGNQIGIKIFLVSEDKIIKTRAGKYKLVINSLFKKP